MAVSTPIIEKIAAHEFLTEDDDVQFQITRKNWVSLWDDRNWASLFFEKIEKLWVEYFGSYSNECACSLSKVSFLNKINRIIHDEISVYIQQADFFGYHTINDLAEGIFNTVLSQDAIDAKKLSQELKISEFLLPKSGSGESLQSSSKGGLSQEKHNIGAPLFPQVLPGGLSEASLGSSTPTPESQPEVATPRSLMVEGAETWQQR